MSTSSVADGVTRRARACRRDTLRSLKRVIPRVADPFKRIKALATLAVLSDIHCDPTLCGIEKDRAFNKVVNDLSLRSN